MVATHVCDSCRGGELLSGLAWMPVQHCQGRSDRPAPEGVLGGYRCSCPCRYAPHELHAMARSQYPDDDIARIARYNELMLEAGHVVSVPPPPDPEPFPPDVPMWQR